MMKPSPRSKHNQSRQKSNSPGSLPGPHLPIIVATILVVSLGLFLILNVKFSAYAAPVQTERGIAEFFTPEVQVWEPQILLWAEENQLDPNLVATIMQIESCGNPIAESGAGAMGLFQVMPFHFTDYEDPFDPEINALRGIGYLARSLEYADNRPYFAFAGYNGGIGIIDSTEDYWAEETLNYAYWGEGIYQDAVSASPNSSRLEEWLTAGGNSLCYSANTTLGLGY